MKAFRANSERPRKQGQPNSPSSHESPGGSVGNGSWNGTDTSEIDRLSFAIRAHRFRFTATIMQRNAIPLAAEYAVRLVHAVPDLATEDIAAFFGFGSAEAEILVQDMLATGLVSEREGRFSLSSRGIAAVSDDDVELFETEELAVTQAFELIAFTPVDDNELTGVFGRIVPEIAIPDRERAANATEGARDAFDLHFRELAQRHSRRRRPEDIRLHLVEDVHFMRAFGAHFELPIRYRQDDASIGALGVDPDFSSLRHRGRVSSRDPVIAALSARVQSLQAPADFDDALSRTASIDGGILTRSDLKSSEGQAAWAQSCTDKSARQLEGEQGPGMRVMGSVAATAIGSALLRTAPSAEQERLDVPTPVLWLPPGAGYWGRSVAFANIARELSAADPDGTVLLARTSDTQQSWKNWRTLYGPRHDQPGLFDRSLAVQTDLPNALEVVMKPGAWALVLVHVPVAQGTYPIPFGYLTTSPRLVSRWRDALAEVAITADGSKSILWCDKSETAADALAVIDLALGIGAAT
ncbi:conserved hypothetical protein [Bosea sp. 62]|uniref:hypothetical protein n=1 Tax=unclassified Bosea (in: a-proteobacteria) TaxID=2653178 RepID=UPI001255AED3|nr:MULTISPECIES: hypothetical protein [unclassified Bosea (in: a-proteobacteria)]CAD5294971.1 conserved hypothetical protein [Bosea sp. 21B]CAD5295418.1 conserved hypothetical protein [Bosea sp. 46]CAD5298417.1 conserved hypothetical protein [Bosea sp. 7B]VVT60938.1 conserved hypothetical protein [Bosea sp. EC-HK365B]VXB35652.1 conserved hypothetical protein [Bosea sp. 127]